MTETVTVFFRDERMNSRTHQGVTDVRIIEGVMRVLMEGNAYIYPLDTIRFSHTQLDTTD